VVLFQKRVGVLKIYVKINGAQKVHQMNQVIEAVALSGASWKDAKSYMQSELSPDQVKESIVKICQKRGDISFFEDYLREEGSVSVGVVAALLRVFKQQPMLILKNSILDKIENINANDFLLLKTCINLNCSHQILKTLIEKMNFSVDDGKFIKGLIYQGNQDLWGMIQQYASPPFIKWKISELSACWPQLDDAQKSFIFSGLNFEKNDFCDLFVLHLMREGQHSYGLSLLEKGFESGNVKESDKLTWLCALAQFGTLWKNVQFLVKDLDPQEILKKGVSLDLLGYKEAIEWLAQSDANKNFMFSLLMKQGRAGSGNGPMAFNLGALFSHSASTGPGPPSFNPDDTAALILLGWRFLTSEQRELVAHRSEIIMDLDLQDSMSSAALEKLADYFRPEKLKNLIITIMNGEGWEEEDGERYRKSGFLMGFLPVEETPKLLFDVFLNHQDAPQWNAAYRAKVLKEKFEMMWGDDGEPAPTVKKPRL